MKYRQIDDFNQPPDIAIKFDAFVRRQVELDDQADMAPHAIPRGVRTLAGTTATEIIYPSGRFFGGVRYISDEPFCSLDLRTFTDPSAPTEFHTAYSYAPHISGLLLAREVKGTCYDVIGNEIPGTPQALATLLDREPFERGMLADELDKQTYGVVGEEEFAALGHFLVGRSIDLAVSE